MLREAERSLSIAQWGSVRLMVHALRDNRLQGLGRAATHAAWVSVGEAGSGDLTTVSGSAVRERIVAELRPKAKEFSRLYAEVVPEPAARAAWTWLDRGVGDGGVDAAWEPLLQPQALRMMVTLGGSGDEKQEERRLGDKQLVSKIAGVVSTFVLEILVLLRVFLPSFELPAWIWGAVLAPDAGSAATSCDPSSSPKDHWCRFYLGFLGLNVLQLIMYDLPGYYVASKFVNPKAPVWMGNVTPVTWVDTLPGNWLTRCGTLLRRSNGWYDTEKPHVAGDNAQDSWKSVAFKSRPDVGGNTLDLTGYYLPSPRRSSPTVVFAHGRSVDINSPPVQAIAFMLRSMNFNVLMVSLRNYGPSEHTPKGTLSWSTEYLDVLGAWDYAVSDPGGELGTGGSDPSRVGVMGQSAGGLVAKVAFGVEARIPALLVDSAMLSAEAILKYSIGKTVGDDLAPLLLNQGMAYTARLSDYDHEWTPEVQLPKAPLGRKIGVIHNEADNVVPVSQAREFADMAGSFGYSVAMEWYPVVDTPPDCEETCKDTRPKKCLHASVAFAEPQKYRQFLCDFWSAAFSLGEEWCELDRWLGDERFTFGT